MAADDDADDDDRSGGVLVCGGLEAGERNEAEKSRLDLNLTRADARSFLTRPLRPPRSRLPSPSLSFSHFLCERNCRNGPPFWRAIFCFNFRRIHGAAKFLALRNLGAVSNRRNSSLLQTLARLKAELGHWSERKRPHQEKWLTG